MGLVNGQQGVWKHVTGEGPVLAVAVHSGHDLRPEVRTMMALGEEDRLREEDPFTEDLAAIAPNQLIFTRSRFEVDLNRPRDRAVYLTPEDAWGLQVWKEPPSAVLLAAAREEYDNFYAVLKDALSVLERAHRRFIVLDLHSYNHRRQGPHAEAADPEGCPVVNLGTGNLNRGLWAPVVEAFIESLSRQTLLGKPIDVRENVRFRGGYLSQWVAEHFPSSACVLAIEIKKVFMDEWSGQLNHEAFAELRFALTGTLPSMLKALGSLRPRVPRSGKSPLSSAIRIGIVVNDVQTEQAGYTTTRIAMTAKQMGHEVFLMGVGDLAYDADEEIRSRAITVPKRVYKSGDAFLKDLQGKNAVQERITVSDLDILLLRNDPAQDAVRRPWAAQAGILFGRLALRSGVIVLNDPNGLAKATSKMYFQTFPARIRPETIITRNADDIRAFARARGTVVLKPLTGSGGQSVFLVRPDDLPNINQMIDSVARDGYVIVQEYLPAAEAGDTRLFLVNGEAFKFRGRYAAFRRVRVGGDLRSNVHAGGALDRAEVGAEALEIVEIVRPKLIQDGMFMVGLDIVGDKLMEINVFSPGGFGSAQKFEGVNFAEGIVKALERKTNSMRHYRRRFDNLAMAVI